MKTVIIILFIMASLVIADSTDTWHTTTPDASIADSYYTITLVIDCFLIKDYSCIDEILKSGHLFIIPTGTKVEIQKYREHRRYGVVRVRLKGSTVTGWMISGALDPPNK